MTQKGIKAVLEEMRSLCTYRHIQYKESSFSPCCGCMLQKTCKYVPCDLTNKDITETARGLKNWSERK